jgi:hypothetical protein
VVVVILHDNKPRDVHREVPRCSRRLSSCCRSYSQRGRQIRRASLYQARKHYRLVCDRPNKGNKAIEREVLSSFQIARSLGFKGDFRAWDMLRVRACWAVQWNWIKAIERNLFSNFQAAESLGFKGDFRFGSTCCGFTSEAQIVRTKFDLLLRKRPPNVHGVWICPIREKYFNPSSTKAVVWNYRAVEDLYSFSGCDSKYVSCRNSRWERESSYCGQPARTMVRSV